MLITPLHSTSPMPATSVAPRPATGGVSHGGDVDQTAVRAGAVRDTVSISTRARRLARPAAAEPAATRSTEDGRRSSGGASRSSAETLSDAERKQVRELKQRDREVRQHEMAHKAAAGPHARGGPNYEFTRGPDGRRYATGGSVDIDTSAVPGDPQATISKMQVVRRAALAPAKPSGQDRAVAAAAAQKEQQARAELAEQKAAESQPEPSASTSTPAGQTPPASASEMLQAQRVRQLYAAPAVGHETMLKLFA